MHIPLCIYPYFFRASCLVVIALTKLYLNMLVIMPESDQIIAMFLIDVFLMLLILLAINSQHLGFRMTRILILI